MHTIEIQVRIVRAEDAKPIPGARVRVAWGSRCGTDGGGEEAVSDATGVARFTVGGNRADDASWRHEDAGSEREHPMRRSCGRCRWVVTPHATG